MSVLVSVIVPAYNISSYLEECIKSILASTLRDYEILLIDDGSTDETGSICDSLAKCSDKIRVFHTENCGICAARNLGINNAEGKYIGFVDGDDAISPRMLEILVSGMSSDVQLSACGFVRCKRSDTHCESYEQCNAYKTDQKGCAQKLLTGGFGGYSWNKLYSKAVLNKYSIRFRTGRDIAEDQVFIMDYLPYCSQAVFFDVGLYYYIMNDDSIMNTFRSKNCVSEKYVGLPRAWVYTATVVHPLSKELETYSRSRAAMFYQTVLRKLSRPEDAFIDEAVTYVRLNRRTLLHYGWGFKYYLSALMLTFGYPVWAKFFRQKTE